MTGRRKDLPVPHIGKEAWCRRTLTCLLSTPPYRGPLEPEMACEEKLKTLLFWKVHVPFVNQKTKVRGTGLVLVPSAALVSFLRGDPPSYLGVTGTLHQVLEEDQGPLISYIYSLYVQKATEQRARKSSRIYPLLMQSSTPEYLLLNSRSYCGSKLRPQMILEAVLRMTKMYCWWHDYICTEASRIILAPLKHEQYVQVELGKNLKRLGAVERVPGLFMGK